MIKNATIAGLNCYLTMRAGLSGLMALLAAATAMAAPSHLDIARPDKENVPLFGPVKTVETEYGYNLSDRKYKEVSRYDRAGNLESRTKWDSRGKLSYAATNTFDAARCLTRQYVVDVRDKTTNDYEVVLNVPARKIAYSCRLTGEVEIAAYDGNHRRVSATVKKRSGPTVPLSAYKRGPDGRTEQYVRYDDQGKVKYVEDREWNDRDCVARELVTYKTEKKKVLNEYEYLDFDEHGNWTQCLLQSYDVLGEKKKIFERFTTRRIEYYEDE